MNLKKLVKNVVPRTIDVLGEGRFFYYFGRDRDGNYQEGLLCVVLEVTKTGARRCGVIDPRYITSASFTPSQLLTVFPLANDKDLK